ncbi:hypothetical protein MTX20_13670 [Bradyrhizobium sp. ISRA435]|nr:hypothetical protein MTX20_13670 [Bradyrhizobium sp. ISRA435]
MKTATPKNLPETIVCPSTFAASMTLTSIGLVTSLNSSTFSPATAVDAAATNATLETKMVIKFRIDSSCVC